MAQARCLECAEPFTRIFSECFRPRTHAANFITLPESDLQLQVLNCSLGVSLMYRAAAHDTALLLGGNAICTCEPSDLFLGLPGVIQPLSKAFQALSLSFLELSTVSALATTACLCQQGLATASIIPVSMPITSMQCLCSHSSWTPGAKFFSTDIRSSCGIKSTANCL